MVGCTGASSRLGHTSRMQVIRQDELPFSNIARASASFSTEWKD
jgi:hypothetical protein